jgi:hypothetical protein
VIQRVESLPAKVHSPLTYCCAEAVADRISKMIQTHLISVLLDRIIQFPDCFAGL